MSALSEGRRPPVDRSEGARFDGYDALAAYARAADCTPPDYAAFDRATVMVILTCSPYVTTLTLHVCRAFWMKCSGRCLPCGGCLPNRSFI